MGQWLLEWIAKRITFNERKTQRSWRNTAVRRIQQKPRNIVEAKFRSQEKENNASKRLGKKPRTA